MARLGLVLNRLLVINLIECVPKRKLVIVGLVLVYRTNNARLSCPSRSIILGNRFEVVLGRDRRLVVARVKRRVVIRSRIASWVWACRLVRRLIR